jgi:hypothetical protein
MAVIKARIQRNAKNAPPSRPGFRISPAEAKAISEIRAHGAHALGQPTVQHLLDTLWTQMHHAKTVAERKDAKERWLRVLTVPLPNLSIVKERFDPEQLSVAAEGAISDLQNIRQNIEHRSHDPQAWESALRKQFPRWPARIVKPLAEALTAPRHSAERRKLLFTGVGLCFGVEWTTIRDALARCRAIRTRQRTGGAGHQNQDLGQLQ